MPIFSTKAPRHDGRGAPSRARAAGGFRALVPLSAALSLMAALGLSSCATAPNKDLAAAWYEVGNAWYDQGKWAKAGEAYSRALSLDPSLGAASYNLARSLAESGDYRGALAAADRLLKADPSNVRLLSLRAYVLYKKGDPAAALEAYEAVLKLDPYAPDAIYNATLLREAAGDYPGAIAGIEPLARIKTDDAPITAVYARVLAEGGRPDDAIAAYLRLQGLRKLTAAESEGLGGLWEGEREFAKAMSAYEDAVSADVKRAGAWFALARIRLAEAEDGKGGLDALQKALDAGFSDRKAAAALLEEPVLEEREAVLKALKDKGLAP